MAYLETVSAANSKRLHWWKKGELWRSLICGGFERRLPRRIEFGELL